MMVAASRNYVCQVGRWSLPVALGCAVAAAACRPSARGPGATLGSAAPGGATAPEPGASGAAPALPPRGGPVAAGPAVPPNQRLDALAEELLAFDLATQPVLGTWLGVHSGDERLDDVRLDPQAQRATRLRALQERLRQIPIDELDPLHRYDRIVLDEQIAIELFELVELRPLERSPLFYAELVATSLDELLAHDSDTVAEELRPLTARLWKIRPFFDDARRNLRNTSSELSARRAIEIAQATQSFVADILPKILGPVAEGKQADDFRAASAEAARALDDYANWLSRELQPRVRGELSLGRERYLQKLMLHTGIESPPEQLLFLADGELRDSKRRAEEATKQLVVGRPTTDVQRLIEDDHPKADELQQAAEATLAQIVSDLRDKELLAVGPGEAPTLVEMPPERWGLVQPRLSGLLETRPRPPVLLVDLVDKRWPDKRKNEHLRAMNRAALWLAIADGVARSVLHERSRRAPSTPLKLRQAPTLVEGWAPFVVQRLVALSPPSEARLRYVEARQCALRAVRLIAALRYHALGQKLDDIVRLFADELGFDDYSSRREAERVALDPLSGIETLGRVELELVLKDLRRENPTLSTAQLLDRMLAHGTPTIGVLRKRLGLDGK